MNIRLFCAAVLSLPKSIYVNLKCLPLVQAIKLPILIHWNTVLDSMDGQIVFECSPRPFLVKFGFTGSFNMGGANFWSNAGLIKFRGKASFARGTQLVCGRNGVLYFGCNFASNTNNIFNASKKIEFGDNCLLSWNISVLDGDGHKLIEPMKNLREVEDDSIKVGNHVWICMNSTILKGTSVGNDCVIGAGSVISKRYLESNLMIVGVNKIIKQHINWIQ